MVDVDELGRSVNCALGGALSVDNDRLEFLALENAAVGIDLVDRQLDGVEERRHAAGDRPRSAKQDADFDVFCFGGRRQ